MCTMPRNHRHHAAPRAQKKKKSNHVPCVHCHERPGSTQQSAPKHPPKQQRLVAAFGQDALSVAFHGPGFGAPMRIDQHAAAADQAADATTVHLQVHGSHVLTELGWTPLLQGVLARNAVALAMHHAPYRIASNGVDMDEDGEPIMDDEEEEEEEDGEDGGEEDGDAEGGHAEDGPAVGGHALMARTMLAVLNRGSTVAQSGAVGLQLSHAINALALSAQAGLKRSLHLVLPGTRRGYASFAAHVLRVAAIVAWTALRQHHQQQQQQQHQHQQHQQHTCQPP